MLDFNNKTVSLLGFGISNSALCSFLLNKGVYPIVRADVPLKIPDGLNSIFGKDYLSTREDIVFRSPVIRPDRISGKGRILTEMEYSLGSINGRKIGITGSDGKTTTSTLIYLMLREGGKATFLGGNIGRPLISFVPIIQPRDYLVAEMSSFQLFGYEPFLDVSVITNITENHLDWHTSFEEYINAKRGILKNSKRAVLNYDDKRVSSLYHKSITYFSLKDCSDKLGKHNFVHIVSGIVCYNNEKLFPADKIRLKGRFNIQNALCAIATTYEIVGKEACYTVLRSFSGVENRMETVREINGVTFICSSIDSTPSRTINTLSAFDLSKVVVILGGYDKNLSYTCLKRTLGQVRCAIICGENKEKILASANRGRTIIVNTLKEAVEVAYKRAECGDYVILSPASASFDMFKSYKEKAECFKKAVKSL